MSRLGATLFAIVAIMTARADARADEPPLLAAFKAFCVDTGANPNAVKSTVEAAGGKQRTSSDATAWPFPMTSTTWEVSTGGHSLNVSAGTQQVPSIQNRPQANSNQCIVNSFVNEDASIEAIRSWVGVPPANVLRGDPTTYFYNYQQSGSVRSPLPTDEVAYHMAEIEGRVWSLVVLHLRTGASLQLVHHLAPPVPR
jgi:hypothetical protein